MEADLTLAALRGLKLPLEEREARLEKAHADVRNALTGEMGAIQFVQGHVLVWKEQGTWEAVREFLESDGACEASAEAA